MPEESGKVGLDSVALDIREHLAEADAPYRRRIGALLGVNVTDDATAVAAIASALEDAPGEDVVSVANACLTGTYELDEGGSVVFTHPDDEAAISP